MVLQTFHYSICPDRYINKERDVVENFIAAHIPISLKWPLILAILRIYPLHMSAESKRINLVLILWKRGRHYS